MSGQISDPDVLILASLATAIKQDYIQDGQIDPWAGSPFAWIKTQASRRVGSIGEQLVSGWCAAKGFDVIKSPDSEADRVIAGRRVEIKFSTLWETRKYAFQQVRDQNYEYSIWLGISPFNAHCWVIPKDILLQQLKGQHRGVTGRDTRWLQGLDPLAPPEWLDQYGGTLNEAFAVLMSIQNE